MLFALSIQQLNKESFMKNWEFGQMHLADNAYKR